MTLRTQHAAPNGTDKQRPLGVSSGIAMQDAEYRYVAGNAVETEVARSFLAEARRYLGI